MPAKLHHTMGHDPQVCRASECSKRQPMFVAGTYFYRFIVRCSSALVGRLSTRCG